MFGAADAGEGGLGVSSRWERWQSCGAVLLLHLPDQRTDSTEPKLCAGSLTIEKIRAKGLSWRDVFVEIPVTLHNSPIAAALAAEIAPPAATTALDYER